LAVSFLSALGLRGDVKDIVARQSLARRRAQPKATGFIHSHNLVERHPQLGFCV
jgi:hypothetical protein